MMSWQRDADNTDEIHQSERQFAKHDQERRSGAQKNQKKLFDALSPTMDESLTELGTVLFGAGAFTLVAQHGLNAQSDWGWRLEGMGVSEGKTLASGYYVHVTIRGIDFVEIAHGRISEVRQGQREDLRLSLVYSEVEALTSSTSEKEIAEKFKSISI
jgi:hypothetical protein